jgi:hypothetical protein
MIKNQLTDLRQWEDFPIMTVATDLEHLTALMTRLRTLIPMDEASIDALMSTVYGDVPCTEAAFQSWQGQARAALTQAQHAALLAQTPANDIFDLLACITGLIDQVLRLSGSVQGLQATGQLQSVLVHQQARLMPMHGIFQLASTQERLMADMDAAARECILRSRLRNTPRLNVYGLQGIP